MNEAVFFNPGDAIASSHDFKEARLSLLRMIKMACMLSTMPIVQTKIKAESPTTLRIKFKKKVTFCDFFYFFQKKGCQNLFQLVIYLTVSTKSVGPGFDPLATHNMKMALRGVGAFFVLKIRYVKKAA